MVLQTALSTLRWVQLTENGSVRWDGCVATTTSVMQFYQRGEINLGTPPLPSRAEPRMLTAAGSVDSKIVDILGSDFAQNGKGDITVRNLLLHNAGFPPDPNPNYSTRA